ncbi:hypothetical protein DMH01_03240 [Amycolatopsis sp. WAC 04182]|uniref:hypothetical protein n=1 Tax=Amycolatopsis sp. WAC 04182 TaxID=2203198 RepID=UPI000F7B96F9|nr:hypothetical protein [Amycolatopsis sp. WAC 04182]RSN65405.1 hypothetical protein DMH01_03240 [Amycolatopsis sp. WAC 04182]
MTEPEPPRPPRDIHADCQDHPGATTGKSWTEIYAHLLDAHTGGTGDPADIVEPSGWDITAVWAPA